jgi:nucleoside-diphosphate-sugar epimerase
MKVAVLGSSGFLGRFIANQLQSDGYEVFPMTRDTLSLTNHAEVRDWLTKNRPDAVINCATAGRKTVNDVVFEDVQNNISIFLNFYNNSELFGKFINVGSGAEFDTRQHIDMASEGDILISTPASSYGYSKNVISRMVLGQANFYTLRLFGCFDVSEPEGSLLKKCLSDEFVCVQDRAFDYFSAKDFYRVVEHYLNNQVLIKDINCVYQEKHNLMAILDKFREYHRLFVTLDITPNGKNYTGNGDLLASLDISLDGLEQGLKDYK